MVALGGGGSGKSRPFLTANPGFLSFTPAPQVGIVISKLSSANSNIYFLNTYFTFYNTTSEHLPFSQTQFEIFNKKNLVKCGLYIFFFHSSSFLFQPIFLNWSTPHFRVLSAHRPFQELKIIPEMTQDVLTKLLSLST